MSAPVSTSTTWFRPTPKPLLLPDAIDAGEEFLRGQGAVVGLARGQAVVASAAVVVWELLAEVAQQVAARRQPSAFGVVDHLLQLLAGDLPLLGVGLLVNEARLLHHVARR